MAVPDATRLCEADSTDSHLFSIWLFLVKVYRLKLEVHDELLSCPRTSVHIVEYQISSRFSD